tara:strand:- start:1008 stop:2861 length:1854 start_codon:yes stop_codon:yes gene_type:complete
MVNLVDKASIEDLEIVEFLQNHGYTDIEKIGSGNTRTVYKVRFRSQGGIDQSRVVKVPHSELDTDSVCTLINLSRRDVNQIEVLTANEINSLGLSGVVKLHDSLVFKDRLFNVEEYVEGDDLEDIVIGLGPLKGKRFDNLFEQAINVIDSLNNRAGVFHRDIKPSNFLVNSDNQIRLTDLQNCGRRWSIEKSSLPTRGGTPYTHPSLLNALVSIWPEKANEKTEVYSLAATGYYLLTGEDAFTYEVVLDEKGKEIELGKEKKIKISLRADGETIDHIDRKVHEKRLKRKLKKIPRRYRKTFYKSLTLEEDFKNYDASRLKDDFRKVSGSFFKRSKERALESIRPMMLGFGIATAIGGIFAWGIDAARNAEPKPELVDLLSKKDYSVFNLEGWPTLEERYDLKVLQYSMKRGRSGWKKLVEKNENFPSYINEMTDEVLKNHGMGKRLIKSWLMGCYLVNQEGSLKFYERDGDERLLPIFVPREFMNRPRFEYHTRPNLSDEKEIILSGGEYLRQCIGQDINRDNFDVTSVFVNYFSTKISDVNEAKVNSGSGSFLPKEIPTGKIGSYITSGYHSWLPHSELVRMATAIYLLTDENGDTDFDKIPAYNVPLSTFNLGVP